MVQFDGFILEKEQSENHKHDQCDDFLKDFQLNQRKRTSIFFETDPIGWNLEDVFKKSNSPTDQYDRYQPEIFKPFQIFEFQVSIPSQCHEGIG